MKRTFTPGLWTFENQAYDRRRGRYIRPLTGGCSVAQVTVHRRNWRENARLIAAAPTLYAACKGLLLQKVDANFGARELAALVTSLEHAVGLVEGSVLFPEPEQWLCSTCRAAGNRACPHKEEREDA